MGDENLPNKGLGATATSGGNWLNATTLPPRGKEYTVVDTGFEPNFKRTENVPVLVLADGTHDTVRFKVTNRQSAQKLLDAGVGDDLSGAVGMKVYLVPVSVMVAGAAKTVSQIAEVIKAA